MQNNLAFELPLLEWVSIPAGSVTLEESLDPPSYTQNAPYHLASFLMAKYPVTYAQFEVFVQDGYEQDEWWTGSAWRAASPPEQRWEIDSHPRENVNWFEALAFCRWLSNKLGRTVNLPTEAQWQWAAQGNDGREYPWGNDFDTARCNTIEAALKQSTPVDCYPAGASPFGVMDMAGNVWEWCLDSYRNPRLDRGGEPFYVLRGGSWLDDLSSARCAARKLDYAGGRRSYIGFRIVADAAS